MERVTPTEWFNQFPPNPEMDVHRQWCARHWAPCPVLGANGIGASLEVMRLFTQEVLVPSDITPRDFERANAKLEEVGKLCCWLGDDRMYAIWGMFPPPGLERQTSILWTSSRFITTRHSRLAMATVPRLSMSLARLSWGTRLWRSRSTAT